MRFLLFLLFPVCLFAQVQQIQIQPTWCTLLQGNQQAAFNAFDANNQTGMSATLGDATTIQVDLQTVRNLDHIEIFGLNDLWFWGTGEQWLSVYPMGPADPNQSMFDTPGAALPVAYGIWQSVTFHAPCRYLRFVLQAGPDHLTPVRTIRVFERQ